MPTNQGMFEGSFTNSSQFSKSDKQRLQAAYPDSPVHRGTTTVADNQPGPATFTRDGVKTFYQSVCLDGPFPAQSDFAGTDATHGVAGSYDFEMGTKTPSGNVPHSVVQPEGETVSGTPGSTLANPRGPNVNPIPIDQNGAVPANHPVVNAGQAKGSTIGSGEALTYVESIPRNSNFVIKAGSLGVGLLAVTPS